MRLVDVDELSKHEHWQKVVRELALAPTVEALPVVHGEWVGGELDVIYKCSVCKKTGKYSKIFKKCGTHGWKVEYLQEKTTYCHNCGAKMDM